MGGQNNLSLSPRFPLRALRPGGGRGGSHQDQSMVFFAKLWRSSMFSPRASRQRASGSDTKHPRRCPGGGYPPVQIATPCVNSPPFPPGTQLAKRGPPCALQPRPFLTSGTVPQKVGLLLRPPRHATPSAHPQPHHPWRRLLFSPTCVSGACCHSSRRACLRPCRVPKWMLENPTLAMSPERPPVSCASAMLRQWPQVGGVASQMRPFEGRPRLAN